MPDFDTLNRIYDGKGDTDTGNWNSRPDGDVVSHDNIYEDRE